jgi:glycosyltransferase involved in cell wall biosynthesis
MRFLFVSHSRPHPPTNGGNQRTALLLRALRELGDVDLLLMHGDRPPSAEDLERIRADHDLLACVPMPRRGERPPWRRVRPLNPRLVDRVAAHAGRAAAHYAPHPAVAPLLDRAVRERRYSLVVGRYLRSAILSGALDVAPVALDVDDLDSDPWRARRDAAGAGLAERLVAGHHLRQLEALLPPLLARCQHLWVSNAPNLRALDGLPVSLLPNIPFPNHGRPTHPAPPPPGGRVVLTVASFLHVPNQKGVDRFVSDVWPRVRARVPDATFRIVGSRMTPDLRARWGRVPGVEPVGFVDDLHGAYAGCAFAVSPLFYGGGSNIKVLEALAHGRACVVTPFSARGFEGVLGEGDGLAIGAGADGLAEACVALLEAPDRAARLAERGAALVAEHYSYARFRDVVHEGVRAAVAGTDGVGRRGAGRPSDGAPAGAASAGPAASQGAHPDAR